MANYQICTRCIMDTSDAGISFDDMGHCNHCTEYFTQAPLYLIPKNERESRLNALIAKIKSDGKNRMYDCLIGLSGGVDSSYVAYLAKQYGLRALTVHFDNGWNSENAVKNIENIVTKLGYDYQTYVVDWDEFKDLQIAFLKASVTNAEIPTDHAFLAAIYKICTQYKIKYILNGSNFVTEGILPKDWGYNAKDIVHLKDIHKKFGTIKLDTYPLLGFWREIYYTYLKGIKMVRFLNYFPYIKSDAMITLQKELCWQYYGGKHYESVFTRFFQAYILPLKFNIDKRRAHLSTLICSGQTTRELACDEIKKEIYPQEKLIADKEYVIKKLGFTEDEFTDIMHNPVKSYKDYRNNEAFLKFIYTVYHFIKKT